MPFVMHAIIYFLGCATCSAANNCLTCLPAYAGINTPSAGECTLTCNTGCGSCVDLNTCLTCLPAYSGLNTPLAGMNLHHFKRRINMKTQILLFYI